MGIMECIQASLRVMLFWGFIDKMYQLLQYEMFQLYQKRWETPSDGHHDNTHLKKRNI